MDQFSDPMWSLPKPWSSALLIDVAIKVSPFEHGISKRKIAALVDRRTTAVTGVAANDCPFEYSVNGNSGSPLCSARDCILCFVQQTRRFIDKPGSAEFGKEVRWVLPWIRVPKENGSRFVRIEVHRVAELHDPENPREVVGMSKRAGDHYSSSVVGIRRILAQINVDAVNRVLEPDAEAAMFTIPACRLCGEDIADNVIREADGFPSR